MRATKVSETLRLVRFQVAKVKASCVRGRRPRAHDCIRYRRETWLWSQNIHLLIVP